MKVLIIHTRYQQKGGEDVVVEQDYRLVKESGQASLLTFQNHSGIRGAFQFLFSIWNFTAIRKIRRAIKLQQPDIIHLHNLHYAIGPVALRVAKKAGIPTVKTLHNFRLLCPSALLFHQGAIVTASVTQDFPWHAVRHKMYRNSFFQTFWLAFVIWFHKKRGTWRACNKYIVQTDFAKNIFVHSALGLDKKRFVVNPNFAFSAFTDPVPRDPCFLFVGRLSQEKGIHMLLDAFASNGFELRIAGDGPLKEQVIKASAHNPAIEYLGKLEPAQVLNEIKRCTALVFPSVWYEGMPMTILEAFSLGTPVIASNDGAMASLIRHGVNGRLFEMGNTVSLLQELYYWKKLDSANRAKYSANTLRIYEEKYSPGVYKKELLKIYDQILHPQQAEG